MPLSGPLGSILDRHAWPKANFQDPRIRLEGEQFDGPARFRLITPGHAPADQAAKQAGGFAELSRNETTDHSEPPGKWTKASATNRASHEQQRGSDKMIV